MTHRGPDDAGLWYSEDGRVVLAHRRLSIIDLSAAGCQPLEHQQTGTRVILNGEIYNYRELRSELEKAGHRFHTATDTEVLAAAYAQWSTRCIDRLIGMFAFVVYDQRNRIVFAARDRAGEKPLYVWRNGGSIWFASELKALLYDSNFPRRLDYAALDYYLAYGYVPGDLVLLEGVRKLRPGHALHFQPDTGDLREWRYWALPEFEGSRDTVDVQVGEVERRLETAVHRQLVGDVPVGIMLSGGIDSSLIAALAARSATAPKTFTVSFPGAGSYDEAPYARLVARHLKTEHHELVADPASIDLLPRLAAQFDEPIADSSLIPTYLVSRLIREHAKVALGGNGGDELFGGYKTYQWALQQERLRRWTPALVRKTGAAMARYALPAGFRGRNYLIAFGGDFADTVANVNLYFDAPTRRALIPALAQRCAQPGPEAFKATLERGRTPIQQLTRTDFQTYLPDSILLKDDRASMLASLEVRAPFLDPDLIDFAFRSVPDHHRTTTVSRKILLRRLARRLLPPEFDIERKQGFSVPVDRWVGGGWGKFFKDLLLSNDSTLFQREALGRLFKTPAPGVVHGNRLFALTMLELWRRHYRIAA